MSIVILTFDFSKSMALFPVNKFNRFDDSIMSHSSFMAHFVSDLYMTTLIIDVFPQGTSRYRFVHGEGALNRNIRDILPVTVAIQNAS